MKISKTWTSSPSLPPAGLSGGEWAEKWGVSVEEAYRILTDGDFYATGYDNYGYHIHFLTEKEEGELCNTLD